MVFKTIRWRKIYASGLLGFSDSPLACFMIGWDVFRGG